MTRMKLAVAPARLLPRQHRRSRTIPPPTGSRNNLSPPTGFRNRLHRRAFSGQTRSLHTCLCTCLCTRLHTCRYTGGRSSSATRSVDRSSSALRSLAGWPYKISINFYIYILRPGALLTCRSVLRSSHPHHEASGSADL